MSPIHQEERNYQEGNIFDKEKAVRQIIQETAFWRKAPILQIHVFLTPESPHV